MTESQTGEWPPTPSLSSLIRAHSELLQFGGTEGRWPKYRASFHCEGIWYDI